MTTLVPFLPTQSSPPFQFQPTLDGSVYTAQIMWNVYGQRWYIFLYALDGTRIFTLPLIASPANYNISITKGYFTTPMIFRDASQTFEIG